MKDAIKALIMKRFDKFHAENAAKAEKPAPATNGIEHTNGVIKTEGASSVYLATTAQKRKSEDAVDRFASPVKKKKVKTEHQDDADAAFAARLQAEENSRARPTRKGAAKKTNPVKKRALKKKTPSKIKGEEDSDLDSSGEEKKVVNRSGGFHVSDFPSGLYIML
jgi:upstream activation factor subunit UAF30